MTAVDQRGSYRITDAAPIRAHLHSIGVETAGYCAIATVTGVSPYTIQQILHGRRNQPQSMVSVVTAQKILSATNVAMVDGVGTRRRIRAMHCDGYDVARISVETGVPASTVRKWLRAKVIATCYADRVADLYRQWTGVPAEHNGSSPADADAARALAHRRRWHPAACWDGDIDDPAAVPASARTTWQSEDLVAEANRLNAQTGDSWAKVAAQIGVPLNTLQKAQERVKARAKAGVA